MNNKRLVDATIEDLLAALKPAIREEIKDASDLINREEAMSILGVTSAMLTYYVNKGKLTDYNGGFSRTQVMKLKKPSGKKDPQTTNKAA